MEDVIVSLTGRTSPDVGQCEAEFLHVVQVPKQDLVVDRRPEVSGLEEVNGVEVCDVDSPGVGRGGVGTVLLNMHAEKAGVNAVDLLESEHGAGSEGEVVVHFAGVDKSKLNDRLRIIRYPSRYGFVNIKLKKKQ